MKYTSYDVVIVGGGLAGVSVALALPKTLRVALFFKDELQSCSSYLAQGGIAGAIDKDDSVADHFQDTLVAGAGLCDRENSQKILEQATEAIHWLQQQGVPFTCINGQLHLTKEGGHGARRIAHVADFTGLSIMQTLWQKLENYPNIDWISDGNIEKILVENQRCLGVIVKYQNKLRSIFSPSVVLATGGLGQLFKYTTNPKTAKGNGLVLAIQAGCRIAHLEFIQFHPTALAIAGSKSFLISEALRGEGGILRNEIGERFMANYDQRLELAPRDIVARAIEDQIQKQQQRPVYLDVTHISSDFIQSHFPLIYQHCLSLGLDITRQWIPIAPAAHYSCGGIVTDYNGCTDIDGLYAAGEVACTGLHGANRLASNSLLECIVVGRNIAAKIQKQENCVQTNEKNRSHMSYLQWADLDLTVDANISTVQVFSQSILQEWMSKYLGIVRTQHGMQLLNQQLKSWYQTNPLPCLLVALMIVQSALKRKDNIGAHYNRSFT